MRRATRTPKRGGDRGVPGRSGVDATSFPIFKNTYNGLLRNTFEAVPDTPVSKFTLELFGGKRGLIENSINLCAHPHRATVKLDGQNGKAYDTNPVVRADCGKGKRKAHIHNFNRRSPR